MAGIQDLVARQKQKKLLDEGGGMQNGDRNLFKRAVEYYNTVLKGKM